MPLNSSVETVIPVEEKWDHSLENAIRKTSVAFVVGLLPAMLFTRSAVARAAILSFCTGIGTGMAYGEARYLFDHNIVFDKRYLVNVKMQPIPSIEPAPVPLSTSSSSSSSSTSSPSQTQQPQLLEQRQPSTNSSTSVTEQKTTKEFAPLTKVQNVNKPIL